LSDVQESAELSEPPQTGSDRLLVLVEEVRFHFGHYKKSRDQARTHMAEVGKRLHELKVIVGRGNWNAWIRNPKNLPFSDRAAVLYMKLADAVAARFGESAKFADLGIVAFVDAYSKYLAEKEREEAGEPDEPEPEPKPKRKKIIWGRDLFDKRKRLIQGNELKLPEPFSSGKIFHVKWRLERGYKHCDIYVWHSSEWNDEERYHWDLPLLQGGWRFRYW
jgi:hypothetical protein